MYPCGSTYRLSVLFSAELSVVVVQFTKSCLTLCDPMDCSMPGFPVVHYLLEIAQTHGHQVGDELSTTALVPCGLDDSSHSGGGGGLVAKSCLTLAIL